MVFDHSGVRIRWWFSSGRQRTEPTARIGWWSRVSHVAQLLQLGCKWQQVPVLAGSFMAGLLFHVEEVSYFPSAVPF